MWGGVDERASREEIENLATFPDENPNPVMRIAANGAIIYANRGSAPLLELWGCHVGHRLPDDCRNIIQGTLQCEAINEIEVNAGRATYSLVIAPVKEKGYVNIYGQDITVRKRAEEELKRTQSHLRIAMDLVKLVQWEYDVETDMFTFDDQFYGLYGTTAEREGGPLMSSQDYARKFIPAEDVSVVAKEISNALATTDPNFTSQLEHRIIRADGTERIIAVRFGIIKDDKGLTIRTYGANQDITERKRAEEEYKTILQTTMDGFWLADIDGRFLDVNEAYCCLIGYSRDELLKMSIIDIEAIEGPDYTANRIRKIVEVGYDRFETKHRRKDGAIVNVEVSINYLPTNKGRMIVFIRDITARKKAEEFLRIQLDLSLALNNCHSLDQALLLILDAALKNEGLDCGGVYLADPISGALDLAVHRGLSPQFIEHTSHFDSDAPQVQQAKTGKPFFGRYADLRQPGSDEIRDREGLTALATIPLLHKGDLIAVLNLASHANEDIPIHIRKMLETLAAQIGSILIRIRSEQALAESEERYRTVVSSASDGIILQKSNGRILTWNKAAEMIFGVKAETAMDQTSTSREWRTIREDGSAFPGAEHPSLHTLTTGEPCNNVIMGVRNEITDQLSWIIVDTNPLFREGNPKPYAVVISFSDITERKRAEEALQKSKNEYLTLAENSPDLIARFDRQLRHVYVNRAAGKSGVLSQEEYIGRTIAESGVSEPYCSFWNERIRTVIETGKPDDIYHSFPTPNGMRYFNTRLVPELDANGNVETVLSVARDITDLRLAEEKLKLNIDELEKSRKTIQQSHSLLESIMASPREIVILALDREYRYIAFNQNHKDTIKAIWGVDIVLGCSMLEYIKYPEDRDKAKRNFDRALRGEHFVLDEVYGDQALQRRYYEDHYNPIQEENGSIIGLTVFLTDITDQKKMKDELQRSHEELEQRVKERTEELTQKNIEMEQFIYTVSHDLRTPLVSISGFLGFIEQDAKVGDMNRLKEDLRIASDSISKMDRLLLGTLELSRIGRVINPPEDASLNQIVQEALEQAAERIKSEKVTVIVDEDMPEVRVDKQRIVEVLVNLVENSTKFMKDQDKPTMEIGSRKDGEETVFFVKDNGIGIDPSQHEKVFGLFYRVDPKIRGTGAGLTIVKRIIEVHGGRIWIESELGKGCTVCFTLPRTRVV
jgi:PAS domain S-box-containing protein